MSTTSNHSLKVGWSSTSITPTQPVMLSGQFYVRVSQGVMDPVTATALALETKDDQAILVSCDLVGIDEGIISMVRAKLAPQIPGFNVQKLVMNAIHTHSAPVFKEGIYPRQGPLVMTPAAYAEFLTDRVSAAAAAAWKNRKTAGYSRGFGQAVVGHNRRAVYFDGHAQMYGQTNRENFSHIEGYEDHSVDMLFFWDRAKKLTGIIVNVACPSQVSEHSTEITADYWHEVRTVIRKKFGKNICVLPQCSAAGDQSPHFLLHKREEEDMRKQRGTTERDEIAYKIGQAVAYAFPLAQKDIHWQPKLKHVVQDIGLTPRQISRAEVAIARNNFKKLQANPKSADHNGSEYKLMQRAQSIIERYKNQAHSKPYHMELHVLRIGDVAMGTSPFELFLDYGLRIKTRSLALQTFLVQLCCGAGGYLPTARAIAGRSYEADPASNKVGPEGGQELVEKTLRLIKKLFA
jgi:hypothetical protein